MNTQEYQEKIRGAEHRAWWELHLRHARGESLTPNERQRYQSGLSDEGDLESMKNLVVETVSLRLDLFERETRLRELQAESERLRRDITRAEKSLEGTEFVPGGITPA